MFAIFFFNLPFMYPHEINENQANHNFSEKLEGIGRYGQNKKLSLCSAHFRNLSPVRGALRRRSDFCIFQFVLRL